MWNRALLLVALAWLVWRGGAIGVELVRLYPGAAGDIRRALTASQDQRIRDTLAHLDRECGFPSGYFSEIHHAVLEHVPPWSTIHFDVGHDVARVRVIVPVQALAFPRFIRRNRQPLPEEVPGALERDYFLTFSAGARAPLVGSRRVVASGSDWTLWH